MIRWGRTTAVLLLLVLAGAETAVENGAVPGERPRLGEFFPSSPPVPAPAISLVDLAGNTVALSDFAGRLVLINLWATWCEPCLREMPSLERMQSRLGDQITVVAISEDRGGSKTVEPFINKLGLKSFKTYLDPKSDAGRAFSAQKSICIAASAEECVARSGVVVVATPGVKGFEVELKGSLQSL